MRMPVKYLYNIATFLPDSVVPSFRRRWFEVHGWLHGYHKDYQHMPGWFAPGFPVKDLVFA